VEWIEGTPNPIEYGMQVKARQDGLTDNPPELFMVGDLLINCDGDTVNDGGCGCCAENYVITAWRWFEHEED
jgi:hypothetical protein